MSDLNRVLKRYYGGDPRLGVELEWHRDYGLGEQLLRQVPREELEEYVETGQHRNPDRVLTLEVHEMPDFGWWEPRHDQPWRRQHALDREYGLEPRWPSSLS